MYESTLYIHAPYETVWRAISQPEGQGQWYVAPCVAFGVEPGDRVAWGLPEATITEGTLIAREPARRLAYEFAFTHLDEPPGVVEWTLEPLGEIVRVTVRHDFPDESLVAMSIVGDDGWPVVLSRLKTWLETGREMPWPESDELAEG